uniref:NEP1-interacting protein 1-like n=1 Tax=Erigeron canadensis TaxID=72917 RepID=UPI001CB9B593|nr:NEP1-interacting protein 1-like [Erigeron canadensis]
MNKSIKLSMLSSSSLQKGYHYGDKIRDLCTPIVSQVFIQGLLFIFIFQFGIVGGTIGAVGGALIGFKNKRSFVLDIIIGVASGAVLSYKIIRTCYDHFLHSDHVDEHECLLHLIDIVIGDLESKLLRDQDHIFLITKIASCEKLIKLPKIKVSNHDVFDASGNTTCCSICLQDFEVGNSAGIFPKCEHKFHPKCISQWLVTHNSCPVCRRTL